MACCSSHAENFESSSRYSLPWIKGVEAGCAFIALIKGLTIHGLAKVVFRVFLSFRRKPESRHTKNFWTPAFAGVTAWRTFYETITIVRTRQCCTPCALRNAQIHRLISERSMISVRLGRSLITSRRQMLGAEERRLRRMKQYAARRSERRQRRR
jgi:hypothetical protein